MKVYYQGDMLEVDGVSYKMPLTIIDAVDLDEEIVILLDPEEFLLTLKVKSKISGGYYPKSNLIAVSRHGCKLWDAEMPNALDYYYKIGSMRPLIVYSFSSYSCTIDKRSGTIISTSFFK